MNAPGIKEVAESLVKVYGPFAFGVISLLVIWWVIIRPELERQGLDFEAQRQLMLQQQELMNRQDASIAALREITVMLDNVSKRMDKLDDQ